MLAERFNPDVLVEQACELAGTSDFGDFGDSDSWRDGLARLADGLVNQARLSDLGVEIAAGDILRALTNRLQIVDWRRTHPEVAAGSITRPVVIVGTSLFLNTARSGVPLGSNTVIVTSVSPDRNFSTAART